MTTLLTRSVGQGMVRFWTGEFTTDGIKYVPPHRAFDNYMVSYKPEFDDDGDPADTGGLSFSWNPDKQVSEQHWLSCGYVTTIGNECAYCGEVANV